MFLFTYSLPPAGIQSFGTVITSEPCFTTATSFPVKLSDLLKLIYAFVPKAIYGKGC